MTIRQRQEADGSGETAARTLLTVGEVIVALGGPTAAANLVGRKVQSIINARGRKRLAPEWYLIMSHALAKRGFSAPPELWGIKSVASSRVGTPSPREGAHG